MVLVRMAQHEEIDSAVPGRDPSVELDEEPIRIGPAIDEHPRPTIALDEDGVSLAHVEDVDPHVAVGTIGRYDHDTGDGRGEEDAGDPLAT